MMEIDSCKVIFPGDEWGLSFHRATRILLVETSVFSLQIKHHGNIRLIPDIGTETLLEFALMEIDSCKDIFPGDDWGLLFHRATSKNFPH
ncbi:hypothetical protein CEXT_409241 [Caerostris extrusa]|uniref:Uncharacterized protein n=1 Tax=Caerostris extrusa TaxID=172846 RepID=A0AAV4RIL7_CAEEX|nr:hypothetical protein CEXT_409241 [Caerostris extrusa]